MPFYRSVLEGSGGGGGGGTSSQYVSFTTDYDLPVIENISFEYNYDDYSGYYNNVYGNITKVQIGNAVSNAYYMFGSRSNFNANIDFSNATRLINASSMMEQCYDYNALVTFPTCTNIRLDDEWSSLYVTYSSLFYGCGNYNQPVTFFLNDVSTNDNQESFISLDSAFSGCINFDSRVSFNFIKHNINAANTNLSGVQYSCRGLFSYCNKFNQPMIFPPRLSDIESAFDNCNNFNQPVVFDLYGMGDYFTFRNLFRNIPNMCSDIVILNSNNYLISRDNMFNFMVNNNRTNTITIYIDNVSEIKNSNIAGTGALTWTETATPYGYGAYSNYTYKITIADNAQYGLDKFNNYYNNFYNIE